jgi:hypothetical protein
MKIPAKGQFKFSVLDMPESARAELLKNDSTSYAGCPVSESINLGGNTYPFVVGKFKMTPKHEFEQVGDDVVLCETEAEMKESVQLLSEMTREVMVAMQCGNIGLVAFVQPGGRCIIPGFTVGQKTLPDGKKVWVVAELEMDKATGAKTLKRKKEVDDEQEARRIYQQLINESDQDKKNHFDSLAKSQIPPVPANPFRCDTLTPVDIDDTAKARMAVLRRQWPHCFEIFDNRNAGRNFTIDECRKAYVLDWAEQGENPLAVKDKIPADADMEYWNALKRASDRAAKSKKKVLLLKVDYWIAFNWQMGWCYLSGKELAEKVSGIAGKTFTAGQIKQRRDNLGLVAKNHSGQLPKSS